MSKEDLKEEHCCSCYCNLSECQCLKATETSPISLSEMTKDLMSHHWPWFTITPAEEWAEPTGIKVTIKYSGTEREGFYGKGQTIEHAFYNAYIQWKSYKKVSSREIIKLKKDRKKQNKEFANSLNINSPITQDDIEPLPLNKLVSWSLIRYPILYKTKWDVYHHLFFVLGNGYHWENGKLHNTFMANPDAGKDWVKDSAVLEIVLSENFKNFDGYWEDNNKDKISIYPFIKEKIVERIPDDIDSEYLSGLLDYLDYALSHKQIFTSHKEDAREDVQYIYGSLKKRFLV